MTNQALTGTPTSRRFALCPSTIVAGQPVLLGSIPAVALDNYQANVGGTTFLIGGTFNLTVIGQSAESPTSGHQINLGDKIYANTVSTDPTTNVVIIGALDANTSGIFFGYLDPDNSVNAGSILSGVTNTAAGVLLPNGA
jgi:predicted RecA/RadA family phage recombinase